MKKSLAFVLVVFAQGVSSADAPQDVSLLQLIATPERFEGATVRLKGYLHIEFEGNGLYVHREDYEHFLSRNGVWIDMPAQTKVPIGRVNDHYVIVEGVFTANRHGHLGLWSGALELVSRVDPAP